MAEDDKELFESAFDDTPAPEPEPSPEPEPAPAPENDGQPRDEHGRFAQKGQEPEPQPAEPQQRPDAIPSWRLKEEADARRAAEERASRMDRELAEIRRQLAEQSKKAEPEKPAPEPWDPGYTDYVQSQATAQIEKRYEAVIDAMSKETAFARHTEEVVKAAEQAFMQAVQNRTLDPTDYQRVANAPNRYSAAVEWHKRQQVLGTVGDDPNAWLERQLEERLKDPAYQAQLLERIRGTAQQQPPVTQLPPSLNKTTRAGSPAEDDDSDAGLLKAALRR